MIKIVMGITAMFLIASLVYAASPSVDLPITIIPSGSPPGDVTPQPAVAAGFNTLIIDFDFTQSNPWSDRSRWLRCHDGSGAANPILYQDWDGFGGWRMPPCSNISQATDPFGSLALHIIMDPASLNTLGCTPNCDNIAVAAMTLQTTDSAGNGNVLPSNIYVEVTGLPKSSDPAMGHLFADFWSYANDIGTEWDGIEWFGNNIGFSTYHNNTSGNVQSTNEVDSMDQSAYHKYAWRVTSNGGNDGFFCSYKDDAPAASSPGNCITWNPTSGQAANSNHATVQFETGYAGCGTGGISCPNSSVEVWVRRLRVWSCAGINSGATCHSSSANP